MRASSYDFRIEVGNCTFGIEAPSKANIKSINVPLLAYESGAVEAVNARLLIW